MGSEEIGDEYPFRKEHCEAESQAGARHSKVGPFESAKGVEYKQVRDKKYRAHESEICAQGPSGGEQLIAESA